MAMLVEVVKWRPKAARSEALAVLRREERRER
jgi:hypothetical protein